MRAALLIAAIVLCAGCARSNPPPTTAPTTGVAAPVEPPVPRMSHRDILLCVVRHGELEVVRLEYNTRSGDSTYQGVPLAQAFPLDSTYAGATEWFAANEPIRMDGRIFVRYGDPRLLGVQEVTPVGEYRGVRVFADAGGHLPPERVYLPVRPGCVFQPYGINTR
jgi:hypothetical protein